MSIAEARRFIDTVCIDEELAKSLERYKHSPSLLHADIRRRGFNCTPEEIKDEILERLSGHLTADQLVMVSAGRMSTESIIGIAAVGTVFLGATAAVAAAF